MGAVINIIITIDRYLVDLEEIKFVLIKNYTVEELRISIFNLQGF